MALHKNVTSMMDEMKGDLFGKRLQVSSLIPTKVVADEKIPEINLGGWNCHLTRDSRVIVCRRGETSEKISLNPISRSVAITGSIRCETVNGTHVCHFPQLGNDRKS